jgi:voltage-dependent potassium channel beta subunit
MTDMQYRYLGHSGLQVSALSLGSWVTFGNQLDHHKAYEVMKLAFDRGVNFFDNAEVYASGKAEFIMGKVLDTAGWRRSEYVVSTKLFWGGKKPNQRGLSRKHVVEGLEVSLKRFELDYVDIVYCHRPDFHTPIEETVRAFTHVINQGKALYWGTSEWPADMITQAHLVAAREHLIAPICEQPQYHMFHRERVEKEYSRLYRQLGLGTTTWSPLASGLLTGKYNDGVPKNTRATLEGYEWLQERLSGDEAQLRIDKIKKLQPMAKELGASMAQLAIAWCLRTPNVSTVILGASRQEQLEENLGAMDILSKLSPDVVDAIEGILENRPEPEPDMR